MPIWLSEWMYPIDKTNLDVLRFAHFLALAAVTVRFVPRDWPALKWPILQPAIRCGQHSLEIFCLGVFLAFAGQFIISEWSGGPLIQTAISLLGILIMIATASLMIMVQAHRGAKPPCTRQSTGRRPRGRRGMNFMIALVAAMALMNVRRFAAEECEVPPSFIASDSDLTRVAKSIKSQHRLDISVIGTGSSTLAGPDGANFAYPARLQEALQQLAAGQ